MTTGTLPAGAYEAIYAEHERDHVDASEPRDGCVGCKMLAHAAAVQAQLNDAETALREIRYEMRTARAEWMKDPTLVEMEGRGLGPSKPLDIIAAYFDQA